MIKKLLIANRGEIALRLLRACQDMGIQTVVVHSTADSDSMAVRLADESVCIGPGPAKDSYLNMPAILSAAEVTGVDAIHPGVGFLAENETFARMVEEHNLIFVGPSPDHIALMGDKISAKETAIKLGIPVVPGSEGAINDIKEAEKIASDIGFPVIIKATAGGGGKGMQVVNEPSQIKEALDIARKEALANFGNPDVFMEKYLQKPRHIEMQVIADAHGNVVHLAERDCSLQRRHQKVWEEAPSPAVTEEQRNDLGTIVVNAMKDLGYRGVGTIEFLFENGKFYFIEMNTRLQVEHPITEMITGIDLVKEQLCVAAGLPLSFKQENIKIHGHAIECRINAENSETFLPSPGKITSYHAPGGCGVRVDSHIYDGYSIPPYYDSLVAKLIVHGQNRDESIRRIKRSLDEYIIAGIDTLIPLHRRLASNEDVKKGDYTIHWLEREFLS